MPEARQQVVVIGLLAFCGPGLFNALNGLGNAGSSDPGVAAAANSCLYLTFALSGYFASAAFHTCGPKVLFCAGGLSYALYAVCVFFSGASALLPVAGGLVLGVGAGVFWTAQGALMALYGTARSRGSLIALFWAVFNSGGVFGGLLQFALNFHNSSGGASGVSYSAFTVIMILGALAAPFVLADPSTVVREDESRVELGESPSDFGGELRAAARAIGDPFVRRSALFWMASNWFYTYDFSGFNGHQFNTRTRGLNSAAFWAAQMVAAVVFGRMLDSGASPRARATRGLAHVVFWLLGSMALALYFNIASKCREDGIGWDKGTPCALDFAGDVQRAVPPMMVYGLLGASDAIYQNYALWLMATAAHGDARKSVSYSAAYKGFQSLGAGIAWLIDLCDWMPYRAQGLITLVVAAGACVPLMDLLRGPLLDAKPRGDDV